MASKPGPLKKGPPIPEDVQDRIKRGKARQRELSPLRNECWEFFRGNTYVFRTSENTLVQQNTTVSVKGRGKPPHRVRTKRPLLTPLVRQEVSHATQRVPSYDVLPTNTDPDTYAAAKTSEKVALFGYEKWDIEDVMDRLATTAIVVDEAFAWPYWDTEAGPVIGTDAEGTLREGEVCVRTFTANEVMWEPGVRFENSRWLYVETARPVDEVLATPGVLVNELQPNATDQNVIGKGKPTANTKLTLVGDYLERPSAKHPNGRRLTISNDRVIMPEASYPLTNSRREVVDEPVLIKLSVLVDPDSDHDHGLVKFVLDAVRTYQDCTNKQLEWKNLALNPQILAPPGVVMQPLTDDPGAIIECFRPDLVQWRPVPTLPRELSEIADRARAEIAFIFSQNDIPSQVEAARAIQALLDRDETVRAKFLKSIAKTHARIMHRCLNLVQLHYTEPRDLMIVGDFGPDYLHGFMGADLLHQTQVRVQPESLQSRTREQIKQDVITWAQLGWITPEEAMASIQNGSIDELGSGFEYDRARAHLIIQKIKEGPPALFSMPDEYRDIQVPVAGPDNLPVVDPMTGQPQTRPQTINVPGWMPRDVDNVRIHKAVFAKWMKSSEWGRLGPGMRESARLYWRALDQMEAEQNARAQAEASAQAAGHGMSNASRPQAFKPMPSLPNPSAPPDAG